MNRWDDVYRQRDPSELSWYQAEPAVSLELIEALGVQPGEAVVDVGGGASPLAGRLLERGFGDVTVLDVAETGLAAGRSRVGDLAERATWIAEDVLSWHPDRRYDLWHDRAAFHFLVDPDDRRGYLATLERTLSPDGAVVIAAFAPDGPDRCSGLPVARYDATGLAAVLGPGFEFVEERREEHRTPRGAVQPFTWAAFRRQPARHHEPGEPPGMGPPEP